MPIDRRITNGLAWAGALVVVAIPAADAALRQFGPAPVPRVAVVEAQPETPVLPTPVSQRPEPVVSEKPVAARPDAPVVEPETKPEAEPVAEPVVASVDVPDPVTTATARPSTASGDAVDDFLQSGRPLPSYITDGGGSASVETASVAPAATTKPTPAAAAPVAEQVAASPRSRIVTFPTPVAERPPSVPRSQVAAQPPLVIDTPPPVVIGAQPPVVSAADLEDWESGPLSEFLARRQGGSEQAPPDYDADGFFLDEGPNSSARVWRFPRAYDDGYYPFD